MGHASGVDDRSSKPKYNLKKSSDDKRGGRRGKLDVNELAFRVVQMATGQMPKPAPPPEKNPAAVTLGRLGGLKGGKSRATKLMPDERKRIAKKAADARWKSQQ